MEAMTYSTIQPPFRLKFWEMSKKELKHYYQWFQEIIPERIKELTNAVKSSEGFEDWEPNFTPASLDILGRWFAAQVQTRPRTQEERKELAAGSRYPIEAPEWELADPTISLAMDVGMYLSQVFLRNHPSLQWDQPFGSKKFIDYGQPVLIPFSSAPFNPVRMMIGLAYRLATKNARGKGLRELYDIWAKMIK